MKFEVGTGILPYAIQPGGGSYVVQDPTFEYHDIFAKSQISDVVQEVGDICVLRPHAIGAARTSSDASQSLSPLETDH